MAQLNCEIEIPQIPELVKLSGNDKTMTVGQKFLLHCKGELPKLNKEKTELRLEPTDKYKLHLLDVNIVAADQVDLMVTSYEPGAHQIKAPQLVDADNSVLLSNLQFDVTSLIEPQNKPEGPIALGGISLNIPLIFILIAAGIILSVGAYVGIRTRRYRVRKRLIDELAIHDSAQTPFQQFHFKMRKLQRGYLFLNGGKANIEELKKFVGEINEAYRIFLARSFRVPAMQWKDSLIVSDIKKYHRPLFDDKGAELTEVLNELTQALKASSEVSEKDCVQLLDIARKNVDHLEVYKKKHFKEYGGQV